MRYSTVRKLSLLRLEERAVPAFGFGSAFGFGGTDLDRVKSLAVDPAGDIYITGGYSGTVDFDPNGTNPSSSHILTSPATFEGFAAKYLADGTFQWAVDLATYGGAYAGSSQIAVNGADAYVVNVGSAGDTVVSRLDASTGVASWSTILTSSGGKASGIAIGPGGTLYVTGTNAAAQAFVTKLDVIGTPIWSKSTSGGNASANRIVVDASGNAFVTGGFTGSVTFGSGAALASINSSQDIFVWKLNSSGTSVWRGGVGGTAKDGGLGIALDASGNVAVTGYWEYAPSNQTDFDPGSKTLRLTNNGGSDIFVVKLVPNTGGTLKLGWAKSIGGATNLLPFQTDIAYGIAFDPGGNVYTTGGFVSSVDFNPGSKTYTLVSNGDRDVFVSKLNGNGDFVAAAAMGGGGFDFGSNVALNPSGDVIVVGDFSSTADFDPNAGIFNLTSNGGIADSFVVKLGQSAPRPGATNGAGQSLVWVKPRVTWLFDDPIDDGPGEAALPDSNSQTVIELF